MIVIPLFVVLKMWLFAIFFVPLWPVFQSITKKRDVRLTV